MNSKGENNIIVSSGANGDLWSDLITDEYLNQFDFIYANMETPENETRDIMKKSHHP